LKAAPALKITLAFGIYPLAFLNMWNPQNDLERAFQDAHLGFPPVGKTPHGTKSLPAL
jgi:hypothetical protein